MEPDPKPVSVLLADFQFLTKVGITALVNDLDGFVLAGHAETTQELQDAIDQYDADLLIMDFKEDMHSYKAIGSIMAQTRVHILVITNYLDPQALQQLLALGVKTIVTKNCSETEIKHAIRSACEGKRFFCNRVLDWMVDQKMDDNNCDPAILTPRENEVLNHVVQGKSTVEIADSLYLSVHTVNSHRKNILKKLRLKTPAQLIVFALKNGLAATG